MQEPTVFKKRALDTVEVTENDKKKFKTDLNHMSSSLDNIEKEKDGKKWNILPSIVHELLSLFKPGEKSDEKPEEISDTRIDDLQNKECEVKHEDQQDKIVAENKNHDCNIIISDKDSLENNFKEFEKSIAIESNIENSAIQSNENVQKEIALDTKTIPTTDIKNNDVIKAEQTIEEVNEKLKKDSVLNFVNTFFFTEIKNMPTTKPPSCICKYCTYVDSLPLEKSVVQNQFTSNDWQHNRLHSEMYSSNLTVSDCSTCASKGIYTTNDCSCVNKSEEIPNSTVTSKDVWTNNLINLIKKNENISKNIPKKSKSTCTNYVKKVYKAVGRKFTTRRDKPYFYNYSDVNGHYNRNYKNNRRY